MIKSNFTKLDNTIHMLEWFSEEPYQKILDIIEKMYIKQVPSTKLLDFTVVSDPQWLSGGRKTEDDKVILVRAAVAFSCEFILQDNNGTYNLKGVFSWVGTELDKARNQQQWMDLDGTLEEFGSDGLLKARIYSEI